jgi:ribosomal protein S18 acetylase RimI-like enzyme
VSVVLETARLVFDELETGRDEAFILALLNEPGFIENIADRGVRDAAGAADYITGGPQKSYAENGFGLWRVCEKASGEPVGLCGLIRREGLDHPDVGYALLSRFEGRGYATEAAAAALAYGRERLRMTTIVAIVTPTNAGSIRVLEKIGLKYAGLIGMPGRDDESAYFVPAE